MTEPLMEVVEGWNSALDFTLQYLAYGSTGYQPVNLTGMTVSVVLKDGRGRVVKDSTAGVSVTGSTSGQVSYTPSTGDFLAARTPYRIRFRVTDALSAVVYHPNTDEDLIKVNVV